MPYPKFNYGRTLSKTFYVTSRADFVAPLRSDVLYMIDGTIDMRDTQIFVPEGGISIAGLNGSRDVSQLVSTEDDYIMFVSPDGGYSGDVVFESLTIQVTGAGSKVFDLDNDGNGNALDLSKINFVSCTSLGSLSDRDWETNII